VSEADKQIVQINFSYTEREYLAAFRFYMLRSKELVVRLVVFYVLFALGLVMLTVVIDVSFPLWAMVAFAFLMCASIIYGNFINLPRRYFRGDPRFRDECYLTFSDAGIQFQSPTVSSAIAWSLYKKVMENDKFYILIYGLNSPTILPKRAFRDSTQETVFRALLRRHVDHNLKLSTVEREKSEYLPPPSGPPDWR